MPGCHCLLQPLHPPPSSLTLLVQPHVCVSIHLCTSGTGDPQSSSAPGPRDTLGTAVGVGLTLAMGLVLLALLALGLWLHHQSVREWPEDEDEASYNEIR